ncbi:MAG: class I SAM-dependent methyltransferase [Kofleriaceae bacterium]
MPPALACVVCGHAAVGAVETATVASNVRAFAAETFALWRCPGCRSIHARDPVDLDHYYRDYPFQRARPSRVLRFFQGRLWRRLVKAGATPGDHVLDYGCGRGLLVDELTRRGVAAAGYDAFDPRYQDPAPLARSYDCVLAQDVIEHVDDPVALLATLGRLARPGGLVAIGTPDAAAIDLSAADHWRHTLHQPYHRHLLSRSALHAAGLALGWLVVARHDRPYTNTWVPTLNLPYLLRYLRAGDDTLDVAFDPPRFRWAMIAPAALVDAVIGAARCPPGDGMTVFRTPVPGLAAGPS